MAELNNGASSLPKQFVENLKKYNDDAHLFIDVLEELQGQLELIERGIKRGGTTVSKLLKDIVEKNSTTKTPRFEAYMNGRLPAAGRPDLAWRIDENLKLLSVLSKEMKSYVSTIDSLQAFMQAALEGAGARGDAEGVNLSGTNIIAAAISEGLGRNFTLFEKVAGALSVLSSGDEIGAYLTVLRVRPYLNPELMREIMQLSSQVQLGKKKGPKRV